ITGNLFQIASEAKDTKILSKATVQNLLRDAFDNAAKIASAIDLSQSHIGAKEMNEILNAQFGAWIKYFVEHPDRGNFLSTVEEWHSIINPQMSDSLFVIITFFFEKILPEYYQSELKGKEYKGVINPVRIGRRKDFWNRLNVAYHDLLINNILNNVKRQKLNSSDAIIARFLNNLEETRANLLTSDPDRKSGV